jgi:hypothetical protein
MPPKTPISQLPSSKGYEPKGVADGAKVFPEVSKEKAVAIIATDSAFVKLNGQNYLPWKSRVLTRLAQSNLRGFIEGKGNDQEDDLEKKNLAVTAFLQAVLEDNQYFLLDKTDDE